MAVYSDNQKKALLRYHAYRVSQTDGGQTVADTARHFGVHSSTAGNWIDGIGVNEEVYATAKEERALMAKQARERATMVESFMTPDKMEEAKLMDLVNAFKTLLATADMQDGIPTPDAAALSGKTRAELEAMADDIVDGIMIGKNADAAEA